MPEEGLLGSLKHFTSLVGNFFNTFSDYTTLSIKETKQCLEPDEKVTLDDAIIDLDFMAPNISWFVG